MKKLSMSMLLLAAIAFTVPSCKKGADDPGLSLKSRAGRLAGDWNVSSYERVQTTPTANNVVTTTTTHNGAGDEIVKTTHSNDATQNTSDTVTVVSHSITFDKEGTFTMVKTINFQHSGFGSKYVMDRTETTSGNWQFLGKSGDYKNKERVALTITSDETKTREVYTDSGTGQVTSDETETEVNNSTMTNMAITFDLIRLSGDEVIMESNDDTDYKQTSTDPTQTPNTYQSSTTEKFTLTAAE